MKEEIMPAAQEELQRRKMQEEPHKKVEAVRIDSQFELPETLFIRDIENKVFQGIILQCLVNIEGIALVEGNFIDNILGRGSLEGIKGIYAEQDSKSQAIKVKVEVNIYYGFSIPEKAEEIQTKISKVITEFCGLHVAMVHVVFKNVVPADHPKKILDPLHAKDARINKQLGDEFAEEF
jgi:uncharacterized alkaline shock family protein YloU